MCLCCSHMALSRLSRDEIHIFTSVVCHVCQILFVFVHIDIYTPLNTKCVNTIPELAKSDTQINDRLMVENKHVV